MRRAAWAAWAAAVACVGAALWVADRSTAASVTCFAAACLLMGAVLALDAPPRAKGRVVMARRPQSPIHSGR